MTRSQLLALLKETHALETSSVKKAFEAIDRADFVPSQFQHEAYADTPLALEQGQTISQPSTVAFMLELLQVKPGEKVLDVGAGSGYTTALLAETVGSKGNVYGVEIIPELVEMGQKNLRRYKFRQASITLAGQELGLPHLAPFDRILVSAAGNTLPTELIDQLKIGGRMVAPVGQSLWRVDRIDEVQIEHEEFPGFVFVPLIVS